MILCVRQKGGVTIFCHKCGNEIANEAAFCHKCGARAVADETTQSHESDTNTKAQEPISAEQELNTPPDAGSASKPGLEAYCDTLKKNISICPEIKSITLSSKGIIELKGTLQTHCLRFLNGQLNLIKIPGRLITILYAIIAGLTAMTAAGIGWDLADGYAPSDSSIIILACCILAFGLIGLVLTLLERKNQNTISPTDYICKALEPEYGSALIQPLREKKKGSDKAALIISISLLLVGIVVLFFNLWDDLGIDFTKDKPIASTMPSQYFSEPPASSATGSAVADISLSKSYTNKDEGISLNYPSTWIAMESEELKTYGDDTSMLGLFARNDSETSATGFESKIFIDKDPEDNAYTASETEYQETLSSFLDEVSITEFEFIDLSGIPARKLVFDYIDSSIQDGENHLVQIRYIYMVNQEMYTITCASLHSNFDKYESVFDAIIDSYKISSPATTESPAVSSTPEEVVSEVVPETSPPDAPAKIEDIDVIYKGVSMSRFFDYPIADDINAFISNGDFSTYDFGTGTAISEHPGDFEVNGVALNKNRDELVAIFGSPQEENWEEGYHYIIFECERYLVHFAMASRDRNPHKIIFLQRPDINYFTDEIYAPPKSLSYDEACDLLQGWIDSHAFDSEVSVDYYITIDDGDGYIFSMYYAGESIPVKVYKDGRMYYYYRTDGNFTLDDWYVGITTGNWG